MTRQEAQKEFTHGRLHPSCPACGNSALAVAKGLFRRGQTIAKAYACRRCRTGFWAWIDA